MKNNYRITQTCTNCIFAVDETSIDYEEPDWHCTRHIKKVKYPYKAFNVSNFEEELKQYLNYYNNTKIDPSGICDDYEKSN